MSARGRETLIVPKTVNAAVRQRRLEDGRTGGGQQTGFETSPVMVMTSAVTATDDRGSGGCVVIVVVHVTVVAAAADELLLRLATGGGGRRDRGGGRRRRRLRLLVATTVRRMFVGRELSGGRSVRRRGGRCDGLRPVDGQIVRDGHRARSAGRGRQGRWRLWLLFFVHRRRRGATDGAGGGRRRRRGGGAAVRGRGRVHATRLVVRFPVLVLTERTAVLRCVAPAARLLRLPTAVPTALRTNKHDMNIVIHIQG